MQFGKVRPVAVAMTSERRPLTRVHFLLTPDADGYPPASGETLWAEELGGSLYRIDNIPFYVTGIAVGDVVEARVIEGNLTFVGLLQPSGHSTIRIVTYDPDAVSDVREQFDRLGCTAELLSNSKLIAVDVPRDIDLTQIRAELERGRRENRWDYEEAAIASD